MSSSNTIRVTVAATAGLAERRRKRAHAASVVSSLATLGLSLAIISCVPQVSSIIFTTSFSTSTGAPVGLSGPAGAWPVAFTSTSACTRSG
jgi:hypothetical protein